MTQCVSFATQTATDIHLVNTVKRSAITALVVRAASPPPAVNASDVDMDYVVTLPFGTRGSDDQPDMQDDEASPDTPPGFDPGSDVAGR